MKVVFIGAGNVATSLATELHRHAYTIVQVYSRTVESARALAQEVKCSYTNSITEIATDADLYIFSVKDSVLSDLISQLPPNRGIWIHTAGSMPLEIFSPYTNRFGVIYPLQTFTKGRSIDWRNIPIFIEASNNEVLDTLQVLANALSRNVKELASDKRKYVHLMGVFACNFSNHMFALSEQILNKAGLPFDVAIPLINETCAKVNELAPLDAQTGPAVRFDENVMNKHLDLIEDERMKNMYRIISESIYDINKNK